MARSLTAGVFRRSDRAILIASVLLAAIAAVLVFIAANSGDNSKETDTTVVAGDVEVVTAVGDINANTTITADMVHVTSLPAAAVLTGAYTATDGLIGLATRYPILAGEQITPNKVGESVNDDKSLALVVPPGQRAISIPTNEENIVGGLILPGDKVDVLAVFDSQAAGVSKSVTLLQNVEVLAVGQTKEDAIARPLGTPGAAGGASGSYGQTPDDAEAQPDANTTTLSVTPEQAQLLALTAQNATLWVTLRSRGDNNNTDTGESNLDSYQTVPTPAAQ